MVAKKTADDLDGNMDIQQAKDEFSECASHFDLGDERISLKLAHMYKAADVARQIALSISLSQEQVDLAYVLGPYHDIGRLDKIRDYGTFSDARSVDHAELSANIIERHQMLTYLAPEYRAALLVAIRNHNKFAIDLSVTAEPTLSFCKVIRDADKVDIYRVIGHVRKVV